MTQILGSLSIWFRGHFSTGGTTVHVFMAPLLRKSIHLKIQLSNDITLTYDNRIPPKTTDGKTGQLFVKQRD